MFRFLHAAAAFGLLATPPARATPYERAYNWASEQVFRLRHDRCADLSTPNVAAKLMGALAPVCEEGLPYEAQQIVRASEDLADALFFESARQELFEETSCAAEKAGSLLKRPTEFLVFKNSLRAKLPELRRLEREARDLAGVISHYEEELSAAPDRRAKAAELKLRAELSENVKRWKQELKERRAAAETLLQSIPFSSYEVAAKHLAAMPEDPVKESAKFDKLTFRLLRDVGETLRKQAKLVHPGQTLSMTAQEDVVQDEDFTKRVLAQLPLGEKEREAFACRLDARYGKGRSNLDDILIVGSLPLMFEARAAVAPAQLVARGLSAAKRVRAARSALGLGFKFAAGGLLTADSYRDIERFCRLTSVDHRKDCSAQGAVEELYQRDCASYFIYWGLALNSGRTAQQLLGSELFAKADKLGIRASDVAFKGGVTKDLVEQYLLPEGEKGTAPKKFKPGKRGEAAEKESGAPAGAGAAGDAGGDEEDDEG